MDVSLAEQKILGDLAERLVPVAAEFVGVVRNEDRPNITAFLRRRTEHERDALLVILAAMVADDRTPAELLEWISWDEFGQPLPPGVTLVLHSGERKRGPKPVLPCGTPAAYKRHLANGDRPDEACRLAGVAAQAEYRENQQREEGNAA